jgi:aminopeptidase N
MKIVMCFFYSGLSIFSACISSKNSERPSLSINLDTLIMPFSQGKAETENSKIYRASTKRENDLMHTSLEVRPDFENKYLYGKANLFLQPYFYPINSLTLDAKGFDINEISIVSDSTRKKANYTYDSLKLVITLDRTYKRNETYQIFIDYTAKPEMLRNKGSAAITNTKGLYFINADEKDKSKPRQVWTQGETEYSSAWFPTIDSPNERMTQEIAITVDTSLTTVSNGLLQYSRFNNDGTRTDLWKQSLGAPPYLSMFAAGNFAIVRDKWRNIDVSYYLDPEFAMVGKKIFGNTPEMIDFFSAKLGVDFVWEKYSEIVVHDFVSGAMENAGAVIFGDFMQRNERELIDKTNEDVISHELFHHWFGDLVTCESWSNLPLNESFATYGEYLWNEYKYGQEEADLSLQNDLGAYLNASGRGKSPKLIRFSYEDKEDMFDAVSYQKGGRVLHMLRKYVGDEAFFLSLKLYLQSNKFSSVEMPQLRLAFEQVTGEDLNWFFNQWFLGRAHPVLDIRYEYVDSMKEERIHISQKQDMEKSELFRLPIKIDMYSGGEVQSHSIVIEKEEETFRFPLDKRPDLVNADAEKMLLCQKVENKSDEQYAFQYYHAPLYMDRHESISYFKNGKSADSLGRACLFSALSDKFWNIRLLAIEAADHLIGYKRDSLKLILEKLAQKDTKSLVRAEAIQKLSIFYKDSDLAFIYKQACSDSSYLVASSGLVALAALDSLEGLQMAKKLEADMNGAILNAIANIYSSFGGEEYEDFFIKAISDPKTKDKTALLYYYGQFLEGKDEKTREKGIGLLENEGKNASIWYERLTATNAIIVLKRYFLKMAENARKEIEKLKKTGLTDPIIEEAYEKNTNLGARLQEIENSIKSAEKDEILKRVYSGQ